MNRTSLAALLILATPALAQSDLARKLDEVGRRVEGGRRLEGTFEPAGLLRLEPGPGGPADPRRRYQGEEVRLSGGVVGVRLSFADPEVALEYADALLNPEGELHGEAVVEVRGRYLVALRSEQPQAPGLSLLATRVLPVAWSGKAAETPRAWLGLRDERGLAVESARRGPTEKQVQDALATGRKRFPQSSPPGEATSLVWTDEARTAFRFRTRETLITVDASGAASRVVVGRPSVHEYVGADLDRLKRAVPAKAEEQPAPAAEGGRKGTAAGLNTELNALEGAMDEEITAEIR